MRVEAVSWQSEVDGITTAYLQMTGGCAQSALRLVLTDALADLAEIERVSQARMRLASRGYQRAGLHGR